MRLAENIKEWIRHKADQPVNIQEVMASAKINEIYALCRDHPSLTPALTTAELASYWHQLREHFCPIDSDMSFQFKSQSYVPDSHLILGTIFSHLSLDKGDMEDTYLEKALSYNSFYALYAFVFQQCKALQAEESGTPKYEDARGFLVSWLVERESAFLRHQEPGLLLISYAYFSIALAAREHQDPDSLTLSLREALKYAHAAKRFSDFSEAECFNAYFGKGLARSNPYDLENTPAIIEKLDAFASQVLTPKERMASIDTAKEYVKALHISEPESFVRPFARKQAAPAPGDEGGFFKPEKMPGPPQGPDRDTDCEQHQKM